MKLFKSSDAATIEQCRYFCHVELSSIQLQRGFHKLLVNAVNNDIGLHFNV